MKKLLLIIFLSTPLFAFSKDVFLECKILEETNSINKKTLNFHIKLDKQLIKYGFEYLSYTQGNNGVITWEEVTRYDDKSWVSNAYFINRTNSILDIVTTYSYKENVIDSIKYSCNKIKTDF